MNAPVTENEDVGASVTFAFGHVVGLGIQEYITHHDEDATLFACFLMWEPDLLADNPKQAKSFWQALIAVQRFVHMVQNNYLRDWKLCTYNGRPATELSFIIQFPDGFTYKGYVDAVLQHEVTGEVMVLEVKTTSSNNVSAATYKNSAQAIGYSIVLDSLFPELSSYEVQYLIYKTKSTDYEAMVFQKSYLDRALWIRTLLLDIETIKMYENANIYPMRGQNCNDFYRECEYFGICTLATEKIVAPLTAEETDVIQKRNDTEFEVVVTIQDLIDAQLSKE